MGKRILLIEDHPLWKDAIIKVLESEDYEVEAATTEKEARRILGLGTEESPDVKFDLLIVDIRIPSDHEGLKIIEDLGSKQDELAIPPTEKPRVIISSVLDKEAVAEWRDRVYWDMFLIKPYKLREFSKHIRSLLGD